MVLAFDSRRVPDESLKLDKIRRSSRTLHTSQLVLESPGNREFFRYVGGHLAEYELTKYRGEYVRLTAEEYHVVRQMER